MLFNLRFEKFLCKVNFEIKLLGLGCGLVEKGDFLFDVGIFFWFYFGGEQYLFGVSSLEQVFVKDECQCRVRCYLEFLFELRIFNLKVKFL